MSAIVRSNSVNYIPHSIPSSTISSKIASIFVPYYDLNAEVRSLQKRVTTDTAYTLSEADLARLEEAFVKCHKPFAGNLRESLTLFPLETVKKVISNALEHESQATIKASLSCVLTSLNKEDLTRFAPIKLEMLDQKLKKSTLLSERALSSVLLTKGKAIWRELYNKVFQFCYHLIETFISFTGFSDIGSKRVGPYDYQNGNSSQEAKAKIELYTALLAYPSVIFASFYAALGSAALAGIATGAVIAATILFVPIYLRYLRPCPHQYTGLENLNEKVLRNEHAPIFERTDILDRIQNAFCAGKGVILTADAGVGKTTIATALAELVVAKKAKKAAAFLHNAQVFSCDANQFKDMGIDTLSFTSLADKFQDHSKELVLFIDEIAALYESKQQLRGKMDKPFLTFCDKFPHILCATTTKEYEKLLQKEDPLNRRLVRIELNPLTTKELQSALYEHLHHAAPELVLEEGIIPYIMEKAAVYNPKTSQLDGAMSLLKGAIAKAIDSSFGELEKTVNDLQVDVRSLENHLLHNEQSFELKEYQQKNAQLRVAKEQLASQQATLMRVKKFETLSVEVQREGYRLAAQSKTESGLDADAWFVNHVTQQILAQFIMQKRSQLNLPTGINKTVIDDIIKSAKPAQKK